MRIFITGAVCLLASSVTASGVFDVIESLAARAEEVSVSSEVEVVELFHAETPEELEAALTDGYPMPWLAEILNDESIPEEDRYWLDCRVRAVIAQDLHLFFDREGNPVQIDADWILPGEDYWRENFIVNPPGEPFIYDGPDLPTNVISEPGYVVNRFGETIGQLAMAEDKIRLSRVGSIGVVRSGILPLSVEAPRPTWETTYLCILYADGSFKEIPLGYTENGFAISNDGNTIAVTSYVTEDSPDRSKGEGLLSIFSREGELLHEYFMTNHPFETPAVSASGRYVACQMYPFPTPAVYLIDSETGELLHQFEDDVMGHNLFFTPNERFLCIGGLERPLVFDCENLQEIWSMDVPENIRRFNGTNCDEQANTIVIMAYNLINTPYRPLYGTMIQNVDHRMLYYDEMDQGNIQISPYGNLTVSQSYGPASLLNGYLSAPLTVNHLTGGE